MKTNSPKKFSDATFLKIAKAGKSDKKWNSYINTPDGMPLDFALGTVRGSVHIKSGPLMIVQTRRIIRTGKAKILGKQDRAGWEIRIRM